MPRHVTMKVFPALTPWACRQREAIAYSDEGGLLRVFLIYQQFNALPRQ